MSDTEIEAITKRVAELEAAQQNERPEDFVALFREDATWVTGGGMRLIGRDAISKFTHQVLPGAMKDFIQEYTVEHVVFVRPDVAIVAVRQRPITHDGKPFDGYPEGRPTYVMAKEDGVWMIVGGQNTQVAS